MLIYPVRIARTPEGKVRATFIDVPEAVAEAATEEDALFQAKFALEHSLGQYVLHGRPLPVPTDLPGGPAVSTDKFIGGEGPDPEPAEAVAGGGRY